MPNNKESSVLQMYVKSAKMTFYILLATSLKDKRQVGRSIIDKTRQRFNASVAEVDTQEVQLRLKLFQ